LRRPRLSVLLPAYREAAHIHDNLTRLLAELEQIRTPYEVIVVSDGNSDRTAEEAERVGSPRVRVVAYPVNMGKGYALTQGVRHSSGELVTFIDADMELDPRLIGTFLETMAGGSYDVVIGSKRHAESKVSYPLFRRLQSRCYQLLVLLLFRLNVRDTQTGLKLFKRQVLLDSLPLMAVKRFAFDLELLVVARHLGYRRIAEAPVELTYRFESTINPVTVFQILWDTAAIFYRLRIRHYYDRQVPRMELAPDTDASRAESNGS
jgi:glycosyltransferase involved in cell wall biosynthesis